MLKRMIALGLSTLFLGFGFAGAASVSFEEKAAKMQSLEMANYSSQSIKFKISRLMIKIGENELGVKYLKAKRTRLDGKLATTMQLKEKAGLFERIKLNIKIRSISKRIASNEAKLKARQEKRDRLDGELLELLKKSNM